MKTETLSKQQELIKSDRRAALAASNFITSANNMGDVLGVILFLFLATFLFAIYMFFWGPQGVNVGPIDAFNLYFYGHR